MIAYMDLRYPVGKFEWPASITAAMRQGWIGEIEAAPAKYREAVRGLTEEQLETPYRPEGWTVRQVIHHVPDSHMQSFSRFKFALTEDEPTIKPYPEALWAELADGRGGPVEPSLQLLEALHLRWVRLLRSMGDAEFSRAMRHPEMGVIRLDSVLGLYAWHSRHHLAHVTGLRSRMGW